MRWTKIIRYRRFQMIVEFTPILGNEKFSHTITLLRGEKAIAIEYLEKGQEITETLVEEFFNRNV